jgi:hypothetical protein
VQLSDVVYVMWVMVAVAASACGSRCPEIAAARRAFSDHAIAPGPHARVDVPFARANAFIAELLRDEPIAVPVELPDLSPLVPIHPLTAIARDVKLRPARPDRLGVAIVIELVDADVPVTSLAIETEVEPHLVRDRDSAELVIGFGPDNLVAVRPTLAADAQRALADTIARWLPQAARDRVPRVVLERAAGSLATHLTGAAYELLQRSLLRRLGELTQLRVRLPELPIANVTLASTADALAIDVVADLPVRRGLAAAPPPGDDISVRIAGSAVAELANWAIDRGHLPQHYTRDLEPKPDGAYRPYFDYRADDPARPLKVHVVQERGGCPHFAVGMRVELHVEGDRLDIALLDRYVEHARASRLLEIGLWLKQLVQGSIDRSRRAAAHVRLTIGGRTFVTRATRAELRDGELFVKLQAARE